MGFNPFPPIRNIFYCIDYLDFLEIIPLKITDNAAVLIKTPKVSNG